MAWLYIYNSVKRQVRVHEILEHRGFGSSRQIQYRSGRGRNKIYTYSSLEPGTPWYQSRQLNCWLEERDDEKALHILRVKRLAKIEEQSKAAAQRLANMQAERDMLLDDNVEVIG